MAVNQPVGDNARKGAVKKRSQLTTKVNGASTWTKRSTQTGKFIDQKAAPAKKKFKGGPIGMQYKSAWIRSRASSPARAELAPLRGVEGAGGWGHAQTSSERRLQLPPKAGVVAV